MQTCNHVEKKNTGFSLMELMAAVAIVGILATIAVPSYSQYMLRGKRAEGRAVLLDTAARLERFYSDNGKYASAANTLPITVTSETGKYNVSIATTTPFQTYTLKAAPTFTDSDCGTMTFTQAGERGLADAKATQETKDKCWNR